ncbi:MAG TPA: SIS domain-containing protein [Acidimicrobiales bacterium]|nr:SIS domain-containing protein [Acidimicrobiales bacterium]
MSQHSARGGQLGSAMASEMAEQPSRLESLAARREEIARLVAPLFEPPLAGTVIVARGSSDHAATTGRYLIEMATRRPVASASPSVHNLYRADVDFSGYVVIGVSQSGRTPEIAEVIERAAGRGARTIVLTNDESSPLALDAEVVIGLGAGVERAVPATKTVTAELLAFALIAAALRGEPTGAALDALPGHVQTVLDDPAPMEELAGWLLEASRLVTVARGPLSGASAEIALKLAETSLLLATAYSAADLRHGPIALASTGLPVLAIAHPGPAAAEVAALAGELVERGADVRLLGPVDGAVAGWDAAAPESLAPVLAVVRGQQLALARARLLGIDADHPVGLTKVTRT